MNNEILQEILANVRENRNEIQKMRNEFHAFKYKITGAFAVLSLIFTGIWDFFKKKL